MTKASYPARSASRALRIVCAAQRNSVSGWKRWSGGSRPWTRTGSRVEQRLQLLDVGRLLGWMNEALIPQPGGTGRFGHALSPSVNDARPGEAILRLMASGPQTSRAGPKRAGTRRHAACDAAAKTSAP